MKKRLMLALACLGFSALASAARGGDQEGAFLYSREMKGIYRKMGGKDKFIFYYNGDYAVPRFLPGSEDILVNSRRHGPIGIWRHRIAEQEKEGKRICDGEQVCPSADGRKILLRRDGKIVERRLSSGREKRISLAGWDDCSYPSYCAGGSMLFVRKGKEKDAVYRVSPGSTRPKKLFEAEVGSAPRCSPDGRRIACQDGAHIFLYSATGGKRVQVTFAGGVQSWPTWAKDGRSICYLQSPTPVDGPWHIYHVKLDNPRSATLVQRNVQLGPDWNGSDPGRGMLAKMKAGEVKLWQGSGTLKGSIDGKTFLKEARGWRSKPAKKGKLYGEVALENEWAALYLSSSTGKAFLVPKVRDEFGDELEIIVLKRVGRPFRRVSSVELSGTERALVFSARQATGMIDFALNKSRPIVTITPKKGTGDILLRRRFEYVILPDRLAADLVYKPSGADFTAALPHAPFILALAPDKRSILMVITPSEGQSISLTGNNEMRVRAAGKPVSVAVLAGKELWREIEIVSGEKGAFKAQWSNPFSATWRLATQSDAFCFSLMRVLASATRKKEFSLDTPQDFKPVKYSLAYPYERAQNTPADILTPMDVLRDAFGIRAADALVDTEGVRTYRHADEWIPYKDPRVGVKILSWIIPRENKDKPKLPGKDYRPKRPGVQKKIDDVTNDILIAFKGMDSRREEYGKFINDFLRACQTGGISAGGVGKAVRSLKDEARQLQQQLRPPAQYVTEKVAGILADFRALPPSNSKYGWSDGFQNKFGKPVEKATQERKKHLARFRAFAREVRFKTGLALARSPKSRSLVEKLRSLAGNVLRRRYYIEGDWCGEVPLGDIEVDYEEIKGHN